MMKLGPRLDLTWNDPSHDLGQPPDRMNAFHLGPDPHPMPADIDPVDLDPSLPRGSAPEVEAANQLTDRLLITFPYLHSPSLQQTFQPEPEPMLSLEAFLFASAADRDLHRPIFFRLSHADERARLQELLSSTPGIRVC